MRKIHLSCSDKKLSSSFGQLLLSLLLLILIISACQKENGFIPLPIPDQQLTSIEYLTNNRNWSEDYFYDVYDRLIQVNDLRSTGRRYELSYKQERLNEVKIYLISENKLVFRDELVYDEEGRVYKTYNYSINGGDTLPLARIYEYHYDINGLVSEQLTYNPTEDKAIGSNKYFWENGNIVNITHNDKDGNLEYEFLYKYDQSFNYNIYQTHLVNTFTTLNKNNIIHSELIKDCTGLIDLSCNPCTSDFTYDVNNYPIAVESPHRTFKLTYQ